MICFVNVIGIFTLTIIFKALKFTYYFVWNTFYQKGVINSITTSIASILINHKWLVMQSFIVFDAIIDCIRQHLN